MQISPRTRDFDWQLTKQFWNACKIRLTRNFHARANLSINITVVPREQSRFCVWKLETRKCDVWEGIIESICLGFLMCVRVFWHMTKGSGICMKSYHYRISNHNGVCVWVLLVCNLVEAMGGYNSDSLSFQFGFQMENSTRNPLSDSWCQSVP